MNRLTIYCLAVGLLITNLWGCSHGLDRGKQEAIEETAMAAGFVTHIVRTNHFDVMVKIKISEPGNPIVAYIEGDGMAWISRYRHSPDPTPKNPLALRLALLDDRQNVAYIARPCQYVIRVGHARNCNSRYWTGHRYSEEVVQALDESLTWVRQQSGAKQLELVGYSGGGALAALVASRRNDIALLRTIAANLDHLAFTQHHNISALDGSLNAMEVAKYLNNLCQVHYSGGADEVVPPFIAQRFVEKQGGDLNQRHILIAQANHWQGWGESWASLLKTHLSCDLQ